MVLPCRYSSRLGSLGTASKINLERAANNRRFAFDWKLEGSCFSARSAAAFSFCIGIRACHAALGFRALVGTTMGEQHHNEASPATNDPCRTSLNSDHPFGLETLKQKIECRYDLHPVLFKRGDPRFQQSPWHGTHFWGFKQKLLSMDAENRR